MSKKNVNIAVIGAGYWGRNYVRNFVGLPGAKLSWVCDAEKAARNRALKTAPQVQITDDFNRVLEDSEVEAVVIATNAVHHHEHAMAAMRKGKHVLVEKPMAIDLGHAEEMVQMAQDESLVLMVGHLMLYHGAVVRLKEILDSGDLGELYCGYAARLNLGRVRSDENVLWSFAPHDLSIFAYLLDSQPVSVSARGESYLRRGIEDIVFVNLTFPNQIMVNVHLSWIDPRKVRQLTLVGSQKMVVFDDTHANEKLRIYDKGFDKPPEYNSYGDYLSIRGGDITIPHLSMVEPLAAECTHFLKCVSGTETCRSGGEDGLKILRVLQAAQTSMEQGGMPISL